MQAALYPRVSTEEQRLHGLSIGAQIESLTQYAKEHGMAIAGVYADEGVSARKPASSRPALQRLLADVRAGKVDIILFTKLDRWFRNVAEYYKVQEVLEKHGVSWRAIHDDYDTTTASGRLKVNIMLSVAQDEADRTSERIKAVFESKRARGEVVSGKVPLGYKIENKKIVIDVLVAEKLKDIFTAFIRLKNSYALRDYAAEKHGVYRGQSGWLKILRDKAYIGRRSEFEPIIDEETFHVVNEILTRRAQRNSHKRSNRVYLFSGLVYCAECGAPMSAHCTNNNTYKFYQCSAHSTHRGCAHRKTHTEAKLEEYLRARLLLVATEHNVKMTQKKKPPLEDATVIKRKMEKLKDLYLNDLINRDIYERDYTDLRTKLDEVATAPLKDKLIDLTAIKTALRVYDTLSDIEKREFWTRVVEKIVVNQAGNIFFIPLLP